MLELEHVHKHYPSPNGTVHAIDDLSLRVCGGEVVVIFGPSGAGKTSLLQLAAGFLRADAGAVRWEGRDLGTLARNELLAYRRMQVGLVWQGFNLLAGLSAQENVALPLLVRGEDHRRAHTRADASLGEVGLAHRRSHIPAALSGGERQRVAVARAIVGNPRVVLADEPTGNLDSDSGDAVLALLSEHSRQRGVATVIATHDPRASNFADRVLSMCDGRLVGAPAQHLEAIPG
jgi:ABC-type lipoprotein export system ATPase subunit